METSNGKNLTEEAYQKIKGFILRSEIYPRQKIVIEELARQMGVSRTPIREAMNRLVNEGYVTHVWNRGFSVKEITADEVEELYGAREALEPYLAEEAARRITKNEVQELERHEREPRARHDREPDLRERRINGGELGVVDARLHPGLTKARERRIVGRVRVRVPAPREHPSLPGVAVDVVRERRHRGDHGRAHRQRDEHDERAAARERAPSPAARERQRVARERHEHQELAARALRPPVGEPPEGGRDEDEEQRERHGLERHRPRPRGPRGAHRSSVNATRGPCRRRPSPERRGARRWPPRPPRARRRAAGPGTG